VRKCVYMCPVCGNFMLCDADNNLAFTCPCGAQYVRSKNFDDELVSDWPMFINGLRGSIKGDNSAKNSAPQIISYSEERKSSAEAYNPFENKSGCNLKTFLLYILLWLFIAAIGPGWILKLIAEWLCAQLGLNAAVSACASWDVVVIAILCSAVASLIRDANNQFKDICSKANKEIEDVRNKAMNNALSVWEQGYRAKIQRLNAEQLQTYPWMATQYADLLYVYDEQISNSLCHKKRPAIRAAEEISAIAKSKREVVQKCKKIEYQLTFLENIYPWLKDFEAIEPKVAFEDAANIDSGYDNTRKWLSPSEYSRLSVTQKNQLALDRYMKRGRSNWEAGRDYERFVGYVYESNGFAVDYVGAVSGVEDRGIDLVAKKEGVIVVIQCKRYSLAASKFVRENTVAQLYGATAVYSMENGDCEVTPIIYTSSTLSDEAKRFAEYLSIQVKDNFPLDDYPIIKCNIAKGGEKIYHLPFDQQYDRVRITSNKGDCYVHTVVEAEHKGFRHAHKWSPEM